MRCLECVTRPAAQLVHQTLGFSQALRCKRISSGSRDSSFRLLLHQSSARAALAAHVCAGGSWESDWGGIRNASSIKSRFSLRPSFARAPATVSFSTGAINMAEAAPEPGTVEYIVVYVTISNSEEGRKLAKSIVEAKLAACVNMVPGVESTYWWEGKVATDSEVLLIAKTRQSLLGELTAFVKANHPYELPEVISLPITGGNEKYLEWLGQSTERKG